MDTRGGFSIREITPPTDKRGSRYTLWKTVADPHHDTVEAAMRQA